MKRHQNRGAGFRPGMSLAECPYCWPGGARRVGGASLVCGLRAERGKARADTAPAAWRGERERIKPLER